MADISRLIPKLRINITHRHRNLPNPKGPLGRIDKIRKTVTALLKHERIELNQGRACEARGYAERLIAEAIRYGDQHRRTMELADFWIHEKQLVHKLFKVLVPRLESWEGPYTALHVLPTPFNERYNQMGSFPHYRHNWVALELAGHPYPPIPGRTPSNRHSLVNVLLSEAKRERSQQSQEGVFIGQPSSL
uniref:Large ribosomal subunit protein bL17m n=1 Tax=Ixodes ricinus TaxID=34613 RepID=A0A131XWW1_IXORI